MITAQTMRLRRSGVSATTRFKLVDTIDMMLRNTLEEFELVLNWQIFSTYSEDVLAHVKQTLESDGYIVTTTINKECG